MPLGAALFAGETPGPIGGLGIARISGGNPSLSLGKAGLPLRTLRAARGTGATIAGRAFLAEPLTAARIGGCAVIASGAALVGQGSEGRIRCRAWPMLAAPG